MNFLGHEWLREWSLNNYISHGFYTDNGYESYSLINILYPFANLVYPEFVFCGLIFIVFIKMRDFNSNYLKYLPLRCLCTTFSWQEYHIRIFVF